MRSFRRRRCVAGGRGRRRGPPRGHQNATNARKAQRAHPHDDGILIAIDFIAAVVLTFVLPERRTPGHDVLHRGTDDGSQRLGGAARRCTHEKRVRFRRC